MAGLCTSCEETTEINSIDKQTIEISLGEVGKIFFQKTFDSLGALNKFIVATEDPTDKQKWIDRGNLATENKIVFSPYVHAPEFALGDKLEHGGTGVRQGGITISLGRNPSKVKALCYGVTHAIEDQLKKLACEGDVSIYLVDECSYIWGKNEQGGVLEFYPLRIGASLSVSDRTFNGKGNPDTIEIEFELPSGYSKNMVRVEGATGFDPLVDLPV